MLKWTDPTIQLVSCGEFGWTEWDRIVLEGLADLVDYHSIHIYTGSADYYSNVFAPHQAERALTICQALIDRVRYLKSIAHPIHVAYDERNVWYRARGAESRLEERYNLADALAVASYLNVFIRHCRTVRIANLAQLVNVIAPIFTCPEGLFLQTIYHPLRLYADHTQACALDVHVECDTYELRSEQEISSRTHRVADLGPFKLLDVVGTCDDGGRVVSLAVVNRDRERPLSASIQLVNATGPRGRATAYEVNGAHPDAVNSFEQPHAVAVRERSVEIDGTGFEYTFPSHSVTVLRVPID